MTDAWREHPVIWLQPWCAECEGNVMEQYPQPRTWCQDNVWEPLGCEDCGRPAVRYVLAEEGR